MAGWSVRQFKGVAPRAEPRLLQDNQAQVAQNCKLWHGSLRPLSANEGVAHENGSSPITKTGTIRTIYRFGQEAPDVVNYWFHWPEVVNVCRSAVYGDVTERTYYTGDGTGIAKETDNSICLTGGTNYPMNSRRLGVPPPVTPIGLQLAGTADDATAIAETRVYTYTYVTASGKESQPQGVQAGDAELLTIDVKPGESVNLSAIADPVTNASGITSKRIYRSINGEFFFVKELALATTTTNDSKLTENLGEALGTTHHAEPPENLQGLVSMPNGMMAGFKGKDVYFCEPYKPHAWPLSYVLTVDYDIVALGVTDTTLVILTKGFPYLAQGSSPDSMSMIKADTPQACMAARSVASFGGGVVYASPDGLFMIGNGTVNLTEHIFTNKEWRGFVPSSIHGYVYDDKYIGFYVTGNGVGGFIIDPKNGDFTTLTFYATAGFYDPQLDALFLVVGGALVKFDSGPSSLTATWRSKVFYSPRPISLGAIRVEAAAYPVPVEVFADGVSKGTFSVTSKFAQRLPAGYVANTWEFSVSAAVEVYSVSFAESMGELSNG